MVSFTAAVKPKAMKIIRNILSVLNFRSKKDPMKKPTSGPPNNTKGILVASKITFKDLRLLFLSLEESTLL